MNKTQRFIIYISVLILVSAVGIILIQQSTRPTIHSEGIDLIFIYGVRGNRHNPVNRLDTFNNTFTKDMVRDPSITFELEISDEDLTHMVEKMDEIGFYNYPSQYTPKVAHGGVTPYITYELQVYRYGVLVISVRMDTDILSEDDETRNLRSLFGLIIKVIENSEAFKNSPKPTSGYA